MYCVPCVALALLALVMKLTHIDMYCVPRRSHFSLSCFTPHAPPHVRRRSPSRSAKRRHRSRSDSANAANPPPSRAWKPREFKYSSARIVRFANRARVSPGAAPACGLPLLQKARPSIVSRVFNFLESASLPPGLSGCTFRDTDRKARRTSASDESLVTATTQPYARARLRKRPTRARLAKSSSDGIVGKPREDLELKRLRALCAFA